ncbi:MAG: hypothetical protein ACFFCT_13160 [Candidatus Odinarchaeota archaeon]
MLLELDFPHLVEYSIEMGYGIIYLALSFLTLRKYKETGNMLAKFFFVAFLVLAFSGMYGGIAGILSKTGFEWIPIMGEKVVEIYEGLAVLSLVFFLLGLYRIKS